MAFDSRLSTKIPLLDLVENSERKDDSIVSPRDRVSTLINSGGEDEEKIRSIVHQYARDGNIAGLETILDQYPLIVNQRDEEFITAIHYGARYGNYEVVKLLLDRGADANSVSREGFTPIHFAARYHRKEVLTSRGGNECPVDLSMLSGSIVDDNTYRIIELLIKHNADPNARDNYELTPIHYAAMRDNENAAGALVANGCEVDPQDPQMMTPLMTACVHGSNKVAKLLIDAGADYSSVDSRNNTVMHIAAQYGNLDTFELFLKLGGLTARDVLRKTNTEGDTPLQLAAEGRHTEVLEAMLKLLADDNGKVQQWIGSEKTLVHEAADKGYLDILKLLVEFGADLCSTDERMRLPLHRAAENNQTNIVEYLVEKHPENINYQDVEGMTPLLLTAPKSCIDAAKVLAENKCNLLETDRHGRTVVFLAAKYNRTDYMKWFLDYLITHTAATPRHRKSLRTVVCPQASIVNRVDSDQQSPLHLAAANGYLEACQILFDYGARVDYINEDEQTPLHLAAANGHTPVVRRMVDWDSRLVMFKDDDGNTPLHLAAKSGHELCCYILVNTDADLTAKNVYEETPLDLAVKEGHLPSTQTLVKAGTPVNGDRYSGTTTLHLAADRGHDKIAQFLLGAGAQLDSLDRENRTALDIAIEGNRNEVARVLLADENWEKLMRTSNVLPIGRHNCERITPMRRLIQVMPDVAVLVMDKCITTNNRHDLLFARQYKFEYLDDTYMMVGKDEITVTADISPFDDITGEVKKEAVAYNQNHDRVYRTHPLKMMANTERIALLSNPLVVALLKYKWNNLGRYVYYSALLIYILFLVSFTLFLSHTPAPFNVYDSVLNETIDLSHLMQFRNATCSNVHFRQPFTVHLLRILVIILSCAQLMKEAFQLYTRRTAYFSLDNFLEVFIYISALLTVIDLSECSHQTGLRLNWQWMLAAMSAFVAWLNLLMLIRKLPRFGIFVLMFVDVFKTFARFGIIFVLFILAFSVTFFLMLQNRPEFASIPLSIMKTTVMTIGEMEYNAIFHGDHSEQADKLYASHLAFPVFFFFCIVMTILLMNLLVGLAVDDIKSVQEKAELKRLSMQVDLVLQVERSMPFLRRQIARSTYSEYPNRMDMWKRFRRMFGSDGVDMNESFDQFTYEQEMSYEVKRGLDTQSDMIKNLQANVDYLYEKQVKFELMLNAIMEKLQVQYQESDAVGSS